MSYDAQEISASDGRPYYLYLFSDSAGDTRLTSDPNSLTKASEVWLPESLYHDDIRTNGNVEKNDLIITFPLSSTFAQGLLLPATSVRSLTIYKGHHSDVTDELRVAWKGRIVGCRSTGHVIEVVSESIFTSIRRAGCTARVQRTCRHALYLPGCNVDKTAFVVEATLTVITSPTVLTVPEVDAYDDGHFKAGMISLAGSWGFITSHLGTQLRLLSPMVGVDEDTVLPVVVTVYPGCDRSREVCNGRFANILNNGSFPFRPEKNPFSGSFV